MAAAQVGSLSMTGRLSHPYLAEGTQDLFATLELGAAEVAGAKRAPVNFALVIDRSGSMAGEKLQQAKRAAARLVELLDSNDRLAIVNYGSDVRTFESALCTPATKVQMQAAISRIQEEGGTNIGDGLRTGQSQLAMAQSDFRVNRLLLLSDGQPTVGITTAQGLTALVSQIRQTGISVTSLGVGADFNEDLMQRLADVGGGAYGFVSNAQVMSALFEKDLKQAGTMVAQGVVVRFLVPPGVTLGEVFGRPTTVEGRQVTVSLPDFSAGQVEKLIIRLTASTIGAAESSTVEIADFGLTYRDLLAERDAQTDVRLSALVTHDLKVVTASRNKGAFLDATRAQASSNYKKAALAMDRGDFASATAAVQANTELLDSAEVLGGAGSVAADRAENAQFFGLTSSAAKAPVEEQRLRTKQLKVQSLRGSGRGEKSLY